MKHLMVRTSSEPQALAAAIRAEALRLEPAALVEGVTTMDALVGRAMAPWRFSASTLGFLGVLGIVIAILGVHGIVRQATLERTREVAIRVALGAPSGAITNLLIREGLVVVAAGIAIGLIAAALTSRVLIGLLLGVQPMDPLTFAASAALFVMVAMTAIYVPARRAARVDPLVALRYE